jgi:hypothetical protein
VRHHFSPQDVKLVVGQWCDKCLAGYGTRRESTVRIAEVHLKINRAEFDAVPLLAVKPSDLHAWCAKLKAEGRTAPIPSSTCCMPGCRNSSPTPSTTSWSRATRARGAPRQAWQQRPYVATAAQV